MNNTTNTTNNIHPTTTTTEETRRRSSRRRTVVAGFIGLAVVAAATPAWASSEHDRHDRLPSSAALQQALDDVVAAGSPGAIVLVRDGNHTVRLASGQSNISPETAMSPKLPTRIGGVTKSYVASVILQLATEGKLTVDDKLDKWLPGVISNGSEITIRQLMNHTSGIYNFSADPSVLAPYEQGDLTHIFDPLDGVAIAAAHGPNFAPGSAFEYSNTNYLLLAMIIEEVTGNAFPSELNDRIFRPLRLGDTSYPTSSVIRGHHVHGYLFVGAPTPMDVTDFSPTVMGASGAILSNADDVADFYRAVLEGRLFGAAELTAMKTIDPVATGGIPDAGILGGAWGLGLIRDTFPCGDAWGHDAENPGYMTATWNSEDGDRQVVVLVNSNFDHDAPVSEAMRALLTLGYCGTSQ
jgi:D-alanyl-D-alanine carboxypeptidase